MSIFFFLTLVVICAAVAASASDDKDQEAEKRDGKTLFRQECKPCHLEDSENDEYTPMTLIGEQWDEFFDELYLDAHSDVAAQNDETKKVTDVLDEDMLKLIRKFCVEHAADSEHPMTCG